MVASHQRDKLPNGYEDLCFHAQQAVEKAVKALLIRLGMEFPYTNDVAFLLTLLAKAGQEIPERVRQAAGLSRFAVFTRYPGLAEPVGRNEYEEAVRTTEEVVRWAEGRLQSLSGGTEGGTD